MFDMKGFYISASGGIQGHDGPPLFGNSGDEGIIGIYFRHWGIPQHG